MHKFPSIEQFRHAVRRARDKASYSGVDAPTLAFRGTVKLHGTNAGIQRNADGSFIYMSRNRTLRPGDDNANFAGTMELPDNQERLKTVFGWLQLLHEASDDTVIQIFGEWCGEGIQKGVAISQLERMYVLFAARVGDRWVPIDGVEKQTSAPLYCITNFTTWLIDIDMARPELAQNQMVEITEGVERECPVGAAFGVSGIGEGVVWTCLDDPDSQLWFKVKGEKHSASKVAKLAAVDTERFRARDDLVTAIVTEARCEQGIDHLQREMGLALEIQNIGHYLRWVCNDVFKEETDTIEASGFTTKELGKAISDIAKRHFMKALDASVMGEAA